MESTLGINPSVIRTKGSKKYVFLHILEGEIQERLKAKYDEKQYHVSASSLCMHMHMHKLTHTHTHTSVSILGGLERWFSR